MQVKAKININKSKSEVLKEIRKSGNLENYHPFCSENKTDIWPGIGSVDYVRYLNGLEYRRDFIKWDNTGYVLNIGVKRKLAQVEWLVEGNDKNSSLEIKVSPVLPYKNPIIKFFLWHLYIKYMLKTYLENVVAGFSEYIDTKTRVEKNKFGKHAWYS
jgi:hypothetical protein